LQNNSKKNCELFGVIFCHFAAFSKQRFIHTKTLIALRSPFKRRQRPNQLPTGDRQGVDSGELQLLSVIFKYACPVLLAIFISKDF